MTTRQDLQAALQHPNVKGFLHVIRAGESNQDDSAYTLLNGGGHFTSFADHPYHGQPAPPGLAAGAYQYIPHTWQALVSAYGFPDFSPACQDEGAVALCIEKGALDEIKAGYVAAAMQILRNVWVSLQAMPAAHAERIFVQYGGVLPVTIDITEPHPKPQPQPEPVSQPTGQPMGTAFAALPYILQLIPALTGIKGVAAVANAVQTGAPLPAQIPVAGGSMHAGDYIALAQTILDTFVKAIPGAANPMMAVGMAQANNEVQAAATQAVMAHPDVVAQLNAQIPVFDKIAQYDKDAWAAEEESRNAAAGRALQQQREGPLYSNPTFIIALLIIVLVFVVVLAVLFKGGFSTDMQAFVIGAIVGSALTAVISFYFGSSRNSAAKDATISQLANKSP